MRRVWLVPPLLLVAALLSGCLSVSLPESGPVVDAGGTGRQLDPGPMYIDPAPPAPGDSPAQIVKGFLDAMLATPVQTNTAREFLARAARDSWNPQQETILYSTPPLARGDRLVTVELTDAHRIDSRGAWQGDLGNQSITFGVIREDGQYRIADAPDALIVPEQWYEQRFRQVSLTFFDPTATILVPEPVFVPEGQQLASTLVRGLLAGPPTAAADLSLSFFPRGLTAGLSVPVSRDGVADIALSGGTGPIDGDQAQLLLAQLTSTLSQDPAISAVRVTIDGQPLDLPGDLTRVDLDRGERYAPYVAQASSLLYGLRDGLLVAGSANDFAPVTGPFGTSAVGVRAVVPDLLASTAAGVSTDGTTVVVGPVRDAGSVTQVLVGGTDLLPPAWDFSGRLWLVDRTATGARVLQRRGDVVRTVDVPGVSGADVRSFLVSRDGSRLVAVLHTDGVDGGDSVVVSRVLHDDQGRVRGVTPAVRIDDEDDTGLEVRDIAWRTPTSLAVLTQVNDTLFQVRGLAVDGAPGGLGALSTTIKGDLTSLVGSPAPGQPLYAAGPGVLAPLGTRSTAQIGIDPAVGGVSYAG